MTINDGGPAFPVEGSKTRSPSHGMTLRDWFAGAYRYADAMLRARDTREVQP
jgi:hypothetical protein